MATVNVNQGESIESALRRFKRKVMTEEIIKDAKKHAFFMSKGQKAKLKSALARKRSRAANSAQTFLYPREKPATHAKRRGFLFLCVLSRPRDKPHHRLHA